MPRDYDGDGDDDDEDERIRFLDGSNNSNSHGRAAVESSSSEQQSPNKRSQVKRSASSSSSSSYQSKRKWFLTAATLFAVLLIAKYVFVTTNHSSDAVDSMHVQEKIPGVEYFDDAWVPTATAEHGTKPAPPDPTVGAVPSGGGVPVVETETKSADVGKEDDANVKPVVVTTPTVQTPPPSPTDVVVTTAATQPDADAPTSIISNNINENLKPGYKKAAQEVSDTYLRRGKFLTDETRRALADVWGAWTFADPTKTSGKTSIFPPLPTGDYPNGDIPREAFPANAWQTDPEYLAQWLPEAIALAERAMEAILGEYGNSKYDKPSASFEERAIMFNLTTVKAGYNFKHPPGNAGYASLATLQAIRKRVLHAVLTEDAFIFVMGGHSAAAGHGNHFQQSYTLQVQRVLEPVLARLGVFHKAHNYGFGGLGTMQNGMASRDLYGPRIDVLMWDSGMTEGEAPVKDIFARAGFLAGDKVPVLWGEPDSGQYDGKAPGAGSIVTGFGGSCSTGMPVTQDAVQASTVPFAARYLNCANEAAQVCKSIRYNSTCWINRDDDIKPVTKQKGQPGGQASWHPGNRYHQLQGRAIAFQILQQLHAGLTEWYNTPSFELPDEAWHLTADFESIRSAVLATKDSACYQLPLPNKVCEVPLRARSEFTPRYNPAETSIRSIIKEGVYVPIAPPNLYDPPEPHNSAFDAPDSELDILSILENGNDYLPNRARQEALAGQRSPARQLLGETVATRKPITSGLEPGQGWYLMTKSAPDNCDGSWDSFCGRSADNDCLLSGHNDLRGGLGFDSLSGWMIVNLEKVKHGIVIVRIEDWWGPANNKRTWNWKCENGKTDCAEAAGGNKQRERQHQIRRSLGACEDFVFEFAIDGKITSWDKAGWEANKKQVQRVVPLFQLLDDANYTGGEEKDVELAIRLTGCARETTFGLSHIYWA